MPKITHKWLSITISDPTNPAGSVGAFINLDRVSWIEYSAPTRATSQARIYVDGRVAYTIEGEDAARLQQYLAHRSVPLSMVSASDGSLAGGQMLVAPDQLSLDAETIEQQEQEAEDE